MGLFGIEDKNLDLSRLCDLDIPGREPDYKAIEAENEKIVEQLKRQYGDKWFAEYVAMDRTDYDRYLKIANECIYEGCMPDIVGFGPGVEKHRRIMFDRMHEIYGSRYDELRHHEPCESWAAELLLNDAVKTGRWKELPDELQDEYHKRAKKRN